MINQQEVETLLRINGVSPLAPDDEIRVVFRTAHYTEEEISEALVHVAALRSLTPVRAKGLYKIHRTDDGLRPEEISSLLGIEVTIDELTVRLHRVRGVSEGQYFILLFLTIFLALGGFLYSMYHHQTGPFHPTAAAFLSD